MKRFVIFLAVLVGGFALSVGLNRFQPVAHPRRLGESIGYLAALLAIALALDEITRRAVRRGRSRRGTEEIRGLTPLPEAKGHETRPGPPGSGSQPPDTPVFLPIAAPPR